MCKIRGCRLLLFLIERQVVEVFDYDIWTDRILFFTVIIFFINVFSDGYLDVQGGKVYSKESFSLVRF